MILSRLFEKEIFNGDGHVSHHISYVNFIRPESKPNSKYYELEKIFDEKIPRHRRPARIGLSSSTTKTKINAVHIEVDKNVVGHPHLFGLPYNTTQFENGVYISKPIEYLGSLSPYRVGYDWRYFMQYIKNGNKSKSLDIIEDFIHVCCSYCGFGCIFDENGKQIDSELHIELFPCLEENTKTKSYYGNKEYRNVMIDILHKKYGVSNDILDNYRRKKFKPYHIKIKLIDNEIASIKWYRHYNDL